MLPKLNLKENKIERKKMHPKTLQITILIKNSLEDYYKYPQQLYYKRQANNNRFKDLKNTVFIILQNFFNEFDSKYLGSGHFQNTFLELKPANSEVQQNTPNFCGFIYI